jgi:MAF protein
MNGFAMRPLILASNSPRRIELLGLLDLNFSVNPAVIDERQKPGESPRDYVHRLACCKAQSIAAEQTDLVIGADTIVVDGNVLLGKPAHPGNAREMLQQLRGREHQVLTGIAIVDSRSGRAHAVVCDTTVFMREYTDAEIDVYVASGDPLDKAGAYGIQNNNFHPVARLAGCYASVMGLPLCHLAVGLCDFGLDVRDGLPERCQASLNYTCPIYPQILGGIYR